MNNVYYIHIKPGNWDYDQTRAAVVIAPTSKVARKMMNERHSWYNAAMLWDTEIAVIEHIGKSRLKPQIVLAEAHEG